MGSTTTTYRYNEATGALLHELDASGNVKVTYVSDDNGHPLSVTCYSGAASYTYFYHYNAHGDVVAITDSQGNIVATFTYDPWGNPTEFNPGGSAVTLGNWTAPTGGAPGAGLYLLFGGMLYDAAAGLYLTRTRAYNPKTGRFMQRDVLDESAKGGYDGFIQGRDAIKTNLYAYTGNNPVTRTDPSGMVWPFSNDEFDHWKARQAGFEPPAGSAASVALGIQQAREERSVRATYEMQSDWARGTGTRAPSYYEVQQQIEAANRRAAAERQRQREIARQAFNEAQAAKGRAELGALKAKPSSNVVYAGSGGVSEHSPWPTPYDGYDRDLWNSRCQEWAGVSLENLATPVGWLAEGLAWGFTSDKWKNRRRGDLEGISNPLEAISNSFKDQWRTSNNCLYDALHGNL